MKARHMKAELLTETPVAWVYFATTEEAILRAGELHGAPAENDAFWAKLEPHHGFYFHRTREKAVVAAMQQNLPLVYCAEITTDDLMKALSCTLDDNVESLTLKVREIAQIKLSQ